jgi:CheY-like chemotaxis protein
MLEINQYSASLKRRIHRLLGSRIQLAWIRGSELDPILGEIEWIEQSLLEMAVRARAAMPYGGRLVVECCNLDLDAFSAAAEALTAGRYVMFGMTCVRQSADSAVSASDLLPVCLDLTDELWLESQLLQTRDILQSIGGNISEYNEPGRALTMRAFFPSAATVIYSDDEDFELTRQVNPEAILLVEDECYVRDVACEILESAGYTVLAARNPKEALAVFEKHGPFKLLVTDVVMPGMNGRDLAQKLTSLQPDLKTIYMSGYTDNAVVRHGFQAANITYIQKPFTLETLTTKVKEVLASTPA